ncbi:MAG TPA: EamA family transporter [Anaerolineales bacterium]|nr:EamA family transporter [Anaerolineales bacterium]
MKWRIWLALFSIYIIWGSTYLAIQFAIESMPPFLMASLRFLIAGGILYIWRILAGDTPPQAIHWRSTIVIGLFLLMGGNGGVVWAEQRVPSGIASVLIGATPLWMVLLDAIRPGGTRPETKTMLGTLLGFSGIIFLIGPFEEQSMQGSIDLIGAMVLLLAAMLWATGSIYGRQAQLPASPLLTTGMEMLAGGVGLFVLGTVSGEWNRLDIQAIQTSSILGFLYLIFFGSLVAYSAYSWLLRVAPIPLIATYAYVNPLVAIFLGVVIANEPFTIRTLLSTFIIVGAVALINTTRK